MPDRASLIYVHDPMCSWCWGFRPVLTQLRSRLPPQVCFEHLLGGLAADSDQAMPAALQQQLQQTWQQIAKHIPGTRFNFDFWRDCQPRRSTYPACRAVIAARLAGIDDPDRMTLAIQQAYYLRAMNPSDAATLIQLADELGLDSRTFETLLHSEQVDRLLHEEIAAARSIGVQSYPSLVLRTADNGDLPVAIDYLNADAMLATVQTLIAGRA